jgi:hypothetical protein
VPVTFRVTTEGPGNAYWKGDGVCGVLQPSVGTTATTTASTKDRPMTTSPNQAVDAATGQRPRRCHSIGETVADDGCDRHRRGRQPVLPGLDGSAGSRTTPPYVQGGIAQTFATVPGQRYVATFDLAGNPARPPALKPMRVMAAGQSAEFVFDITGKTARTMGWVRRGETRRVVTNELPRRRPDRGRGPRPGSSAGEVAAPARAVSIRCWRCGRDAGSRDGSARSAG